jgi:spermidine synthase
VKPWKLLGEASTPDGHEMRLIARDGEFVILLDGKTLMSSRLHGSEEELALAACPPVSDRKKPTVLVGGLGMGFTLRATLNLLPADATVVVSELMAAVVDWNSTGALAALAGYPLKDPRVRILMQDVGSTLQNATNRFDAILLDVDNGPSAFTSDENQELYDNDGVAAAHAALKSGGALAVWSAAEDQTYERRLRAHGFEASAKRVRARPNKGGARHTIFLGLKP